jgi:hypothetical protein
MSNAMAVLPFRRRNTYRMPVALLAKRTATPTT